jgi:hypothetical protein
MLRCWRDWLRANETAVVLAERTGNRAARARAPNDMGIAYQRMGRYEASMICLQEARTISSELGDRLGQATRLGNLAGAFTHKGPHALPAAR